MIVCLGWGSLIWQAGNLEKTGTWEEDGPKVSVEYLRQSKDGRLTLVIDHESPPSPSLWVKMQSEDFNEAIDNLRKREGTNKKFIGSWSNGEPDPDDVPELGSWAEANEVTAVIWTALPAKFNNENHVKLSMEEAVTYIEGLKATEKELAEEYIRKTPQQIRTPFRNEFEKRFQWLPIPNDAT